MAEIYSHIKTSKITALNEIFHCLLNPSQELYFDNKFINNKLIHKITKLILDYVDESSHNKLIAILWPKSQSHYFHINYIKKLCSLIWSEKWNECRDIISELLNKPIWKSSQFSSKINKIIDSEVKLITCMLKNYNSPDNENMFIVTPNSINTCYGKTFQFQEEYNSDLPSLSNLGPVYVLDHDSDGDFKQYALGIPDIYTILYDQKDFISNTQTMNNFCDDARTSLRKRFELQVDFTRQFYC